MRNWFISKVAYEKMLENGMQKRVVEPYLVEPSPIRRLKHAR